MFAYCGNCPVNNADPKGESFRSLFNLFANLKRLVALYAKYGKPNSSLGAARNYVFVKGSDDENTPNCYAFAEGLGTNDQPGQVSGQKPLNPYKVHSVEKVYQYVEQDQIERGRSIRPLSGADAPVFPNEYRVALRVGTKLYYDPYESHISGHIVYRWDYHFMVQVSDGSWAEKHGYSGNSYCNPIGLNPENISWDLWPYVGYYDSPIVYYAIGG